MHGLSSRIAAGRARNGRQGVWVSARTVWKMLALAAAHRQEGRDSPGSRDWPACRIADESAVTRAVTRRRIGRDSPANHRTRPWHTDGDLCSKRVWVALRIAKKAAPSCFRC